MTAIKAGILTPMMKSELEKAEAERAKGQRRHRGPGYHDVAEGQEAFSIAP